jgi:soluble lytic murein transglycosylase
MKKLRNILILAVILGLAVGFVGVRMRFPIRHLDLVRAHAGELDEAWILAVIMAESSFREGAQSPAGARGLMQLMPETAAWLAQLMDMEDFSPDDVWGAETNIALGSYYLNWLADRFNGDMRLVLAAYNAGQGNVANWLNNPELSYDGVTLDSIPFSETYHYVNRVNFNRRVYSFLLWFYR